MHSCNIPQNYDFIIICGFSQFQVQIHSLTPIKIPQEKYLIFFRLRSAVISFTLTLHFDSYPVINNVYAIIYCCIPSREVKTKNLCIYRTE